MIYETLSLPAAPGEGKLTVYAPDNFGSIDPDRRRPAVIICPGGAYQICSPREAEPVALQLLAKDLCVFVLDYALAPRRYPDALIQLAAAVALVRQEADRCHVDPEQVYVLGFSAGGHLACSLGVRWQEPWLARRIGKTPEEIRPDGMVLCYPVITGGPFTHAGSMENLTGSSREEDWQAQSLEKLVTPDTPPTFLWHTWTDNAVPVENSLLLAGELRKAGVAAQLHLYPTGCHGLSLGNRLTCDPEQSPYLMEPGIGDWVDKAAAWIRRKP